MRLVQRPCWAVLGLMLSCVPACEEAPQGTVPPAPTQNAPTAAASAVDAATDGAELASWGVAIDPDKDCKFTLGLGSLTIDVPAAWHDLCGVPIFSPPKLNAPRILREVDGDFVLTVKVSSDFKPRLPSTSVSTLPYNGAGILLWSDSDNFIRLERATAVRDGRILAYISFEKQEYGHGRHMGDEFVKEGDCYLRLERKGSQILAAFSGAGAAWKQLLSIDTAVPGKLNIPSYIRTDDVWPNKLKVGLAAISTSSDPFSVKFEQFDLKTK